MLGSELAFKSVFCGEARRGEREQGADSIPPAIPPVYPGIEMGLFSAGGSKAAARAEPLRVRGRA